MDVRGIGVVVTGASRGLGASLSKELARRGARVAMVARSAEELERVAGEIRAEGHEAHAVVADVGEKEDTYRIAGVAAALVGPIGVVVNNASTLGRLPLLDLLDTDCEDLERVLAVNLVGPFRLIKAVAGAMTLQGRGLVVNVTSDASVVGYPRWGAYGVSKAALDQLGRIWAAELAATGVQFVTLDPGEMSTRMHADAVPDADPSTLADPADVARAVVRMIVGHETISNGAREEVRRWSATP